MRRDDSVFFFTLIDFLVQVLFFGLAFYTVVAYINAKANGGETDKIDRSKVHIVTNWTWSSSIPSLADSLHPLKKPSDDFAKWAGFISSHRYDDVVLNFNMVNDNGGRGKVGDAIRKLGKPSCLARDAQRNTATGIADFRLTDDRITLQSGSPEFMDLAKRLGVPVSLGKSFSLDGFRDAFQRITKMQPDCRYFVSIQEVTRLVAPRDAVNSAFLLSSRRSVD